jgi:hypothetical protein
MWTCEKQVSLNDLQGPNGNMCTKEFEFEGLAGRGLGSLFWTS